MSAQEITGDDGSIREFIAIKRADGDSGSVSKAEATHMLSQSYLIDGGSAMLDMEIPGF